jgi:glutamyl-tRNA reductase
MDARPGFNGAVPAMSPATSHDDAEHSSGSAHPSGSRGLDELRLLAINHQTASITGFERSALAQDQLASLRARLEADGLDAVLLSTCNRIELYWISLGNESDAQTERVFGATTGIAPGSGVLQRASGEQVPLHLFRVTCGLDSLLLGESEVMGQVRDALESSGAGEFISAVFRAALRCGGMARAETAIGAGAQSIGSAGAHVVARSIASIEHARVLVVGAGETGRNVARQLRSEGVERMVIVNRTLERAESVARVLGAEAAPLERLPELLGDADGVVLAVHTPVHLITPDIVRRAMASRPQRGLVVSDLSMPHAVAPAVRSEPGVTLHDMHGLESLVRENRSRREREIPRVEAVIRRELEQLRSWAQQQMLRPLMAEFRERAEAIRQSELRRMACEDLTDAEAMDRFTRRLVERLITIPIATLRESNPKTFHDCGLQCMRRRPGESEREAG